MTPWSPQGEGEEEGEEEAGRDRETEAEQERQDGDGQQCPWLPATRPGEAPRPERGPRVD